MIENLRSKGFPCYDEPARAVLRHHLKIDGPALPSKNPEMFVQTMLEKTVAEFEEAKKRQGPVFFDRGIPDLIAYAREFKVDPLEATKAAKQYRCHSQVFVLSPWKEIFVNDDLRTLTFEQSLNFQSLVVCGYEECHYNLIQVPNTSIESRIEFLLRKLEISAG